MFSYRLPDGGLNTTTIVTAEGQLKFDPPVYEQRYSTTIRIIEDPCWKQDFKKVVDFGCAEMRLLVLLRRIPFLEHILEVDIDGDLLKAYQQRAVPLISDHLSKREHPLRIELLQGSIDASVENLRNVDIVIGLEIIEHLCPDVLERVPQNIFGFVQPKLAIFSTPNAEFNVLFQPLRLANGLRHLDHKFEWTRAEFKKWCHDICRRYPNYSVAYLGIGKPPLKQKKIGHVTQMAIFARNDIIDRPLNSPIDTNIAASSDRDQQYKEIYVVDFPFDRDQRTKEEKILDEARYFIHNGRRVERYFNRERSIYQLPLRTFLEYCSSIGANESDVCNVLQTNNITVEGDFIVLTEDDEQDHESETEIFDCNLDVEDDECGADYDLIESNALNEPNEIWD